MVVVMVNFYLKKWLRYKYSIDSCDISLQCPEAHLFCLECCKKGASEEIGKGRIKFSCLSSDGCKVEFSDSELKRFLPPAIYEGHQKRKQLEVYCEEYSIKF